ncbi:MAG TPA: hypothetical protein ENK05_13215 [Gammaproteobacteria bacterium]|nr:hypothetical protein [Gammaproteobacteria bacterium]
MSAARSLVALGVILALGAGQAIGAQKQKEEDSVYQWGRWAVLSPAAGGEPYRQPVTPVAEFNARPGDASEFQPLVAEVGQPPGGGPGPVDDPRDRLPPKPPVPPPVLDDPRDRLPPKPPAPPPALE